MMVLCMNTHTSIRARSNADGLGCVYDTKGSCLLELSQPGVSNKSPQQGGEVAQAREGMVDSCGQVLVPVQVVDKVKGQHSWFKESKKMISL